VWTPVLPPLPLAAFLALPLAALSLGAGYLCGRWRLEGKLRANDTRKIFHFTIFTAAGVLQAVWGTPAVNLLGGIVALQIAWLLARGDGNVFFEGLARDEDRPHRGFYILLPFLATGAGGILSSWLFGRACIVGFLVTGWADAIAEPLGIRFGRHRYRVPSLRKGVSTQRSVEGSLGVLVASFMAALAGATLAYPGADLATCAGTAALVALSATVVEAVSHHGTDNFTVQMSASAVAWLLLQGPTAG
jgi:phytol kinase